jgi:hypothetical protein
VVAILLKGTAQLHIVKDLTIKDDPQGSILIADGLLTGGQVDNAQASIPQSNGHIPVDAKLIWPPVPDHA